MYGENIRKIRESKGMSRKQLADKLGITEMSVGRYENNQREPKYVTLTKIAEVFDINIKELIDCEDRNTNNLLKLQKYYEQKKWEYENIDCEHNIGNEGILKGLEIAINIMSKG